MYGVILQLRERLATIVGTGRYAGQSVTVSRSECLATVAKPGRVTEAYQRDVVEPNEKVYGADVEAARNVLKRYRKGMWHINGQIVREALDAAVSAVSFAASPGFLQYLRDEYPDTASALEDVTAEYAALASTASKAGE